MISPDQRKFLVELGKSQFGKTLKDYLKDRLLDLNNVKKAKSWDETLERRGGVDEIESLLSAMEEVKTSTPSKPNYT